MLVITADQIGSRSGKDLAEERRRRLQDAFGTQLPLPVDQTSGDELQLLLADGATALAVILELARDGHWSIGVGAGHVETPLPESPRTGRGSAFVAARAAVLRAKKKGTRCAVDSGETALSTDADDAEALLDLLLGTLSSRTERGWELHDLLAEGLSQAEAAERLGISAQAVSDRAAAASLRVVEATLPAYARILERLAQSSTPAAPGEDR